MRLLGIKLTFILPILALTSCKDIPTCEGVAQKAQKTSAQLNESIYNRVFGNKSCSPRQLNLRLPVNFPTDINPDKKSNNQSYTPIITTFVTFSSKDENFSITRLDKKNDNWFYTEGDTCLAWKWSGNDKNQSLILSMERNLQIRDSNIQSVIFIVSLPREIKEGGRVTVNLQRYTWDRVTSKLGRINNFNKQYYPAILAILRDRERGIFSDNNAFTSGRQVSSDVATDLKDIGKEGGVYLVKELAAIKATEDKAAYQYSPESPACEIPTDLNS